MEHPRLLIVTVGSQAPLAAILTARAYQHVCYICSETSLDSLAAAPVPASPENTFVLEDPEDFRSTVEHLRLRVSPAVGAWQAAFPDGEVLIDFTGGTKCMTAAAALVARTWNCRFQYIGGPRRDGNLGVVVAGGEKALLSPNPWSALGYQAAEQAIAIFDAGSPAAARDLLAEPRSRADGDVRQALDTLHRLFDAYAEWDRFDHAASLEAFADVRGRLAHLESLFGAPAILRLGAIVGKACEQLASITGAEGLSYLLVLDLIANAYRRMRERRFDDAVARLYRATEAFAQVRLLEAHKIDADKEIDAARIPTETHKWFSRPVRNGKLKLGGLRDDYALLRALNDPLGERFAASPLNGSKSPLSARNRSILAHGFKPLLPADALHLLTELLHLTGLHIADLPLFPELGPVTHSGPGTGLQSPTA